MGNTIKAPTKEEKQLKDKLLSVREFCEILAQIDQDAKVGIEFNQDAGITLMTKEGLQSGGCKNAIYLRPFPQTQTDWFFEHELSESEREEMVKVAVICPSIFDEINKAHVEKQIHDLLRKLGGSPCHRGYKYVVEMIKHLVDIRIYDFEDQMHAYYLDLDTMYNRDSESTAYYDIMQFIDTISHSLINQGLFKEQPLDTEFFEVLCNRVKEVA